jgi:hypothetical protein
MADGGDDTALGPIEFILLGFEGNHFTGDITPALADLVDRGIVRLLDVAVVMKGEEGDVAILEMQELPADVADAMRTLTGDMRGLMSEADLADVADSLAPGSSVAALLVEHVWAARFAHAVRSAGGELLMAERIPGDLVDSARATLAAAADLA